MEAVWVPLAIGLAVLIIVALAVAWWEHRQRLAEVQRRLEDSEQSRFMLEQQAGEMDARLVALSEALVTKRTRAGSEAAAGPASARSSVPSSAASAAPSSGTSAPGDQAERATTMSTAMNRMSAPAQRDDVFWQDTQPMVGTSAEQNFAPTMPAPLDLLTPPR